MYVKNELARSNAYYGAWALRPTRAELPLAAAAARVSATEAFEFAAKENIQTHGGIGFTWEVDCHLFYTLARSSASSLGPQRAWKDKLVEPARNAQRGLTRPVQDQNRRDVMDFNDTPEEAAFRTEVRAWLDANAKPQRARQAGRSTKGTSTKTALRCRPPRPGRPRRPTPAIPHHLAQGVGGRGGTPIQQVIYDQEEAKYDVPPRPFAIGLGMCIPTMMTYGRTEQLERYVKPALHGEEIWCQLFSEPAGGSDVAGLRTRAEKHGDDWVINGQKVWTSGAHYSDFGILLARTDPDVPKHKGLTMFFLSMKIAGRRGAADPADVGRRQLQRGLLHRCAHPGHPAPRRGGRGLEGRADDADERAAGGRRRPAAASTSTS